MKYFTNVWLQYKKKKNTKKSIRIWMPTCASDILKTVKIGKK